MNGTKLLRYLKAQKREPGDWAGRALLRPCNPPLFTGFSPSLSKKQSSQPHPVAGSPASSMITGAKKCPYWNTVKEKRICAVFGGILRFGM